MDFSFYTGVDDVLWDHGKIVVSGLGFDSRIVRFNPDGSRDPTWGAPVFTRIGSYQISAPVRAQHLALDEEGRIVAALADPVWVGPTQTALVRLTANAPAEPSLWYGTSARGEGFSGRAAHRGFLHWRSRSAAFCSERSAPPLARFGCSSPLPQPRLAVYRGATLILQKSGWSDFPEYREALAATGEFPFDNGSADTATIATLPPVVYTMVISAPDGTGGTGSRRGVRARYAVGVLSDPGSRCRSLLAVSAARQTAPLKLCHHRRHEAEPLAGVALKKQSGRFQAGNACGCRCRKTAINSTQ